jgi:hypothetical protein
LAKRWQHRIGNKSKSKFSLSEAGRTAISIPERLHCSMIAVQRDSPKQESSTGANILQVKKQLHLGFIKVL